MTYVLCNDLISAILVRKMDGLALINKVMRPILSMHFPAIDAYAKLKKGA